MRTRNREQKAWVLWQKPALAMTGLVALTAAMVGCPNQDLAPLAPCTVSGVSLAIPQSGADKVDLLFMIDNSGSMSEEQAKLAAVLPNLVNALTTGNRDGVAKPAGEKSDFPPVKSLHVGVISSDLGVVGINAVAGKLRTCGNNSVDPAGDPDNQGNAGVNKPAGDDGRLQNSVAVALRGITGQEAPHPVVVPPDPECANFMPAKPYLEFESDKVGQALGDAAFVAKQFSCIAKLGRSGCGLEQQLESMLKAVTPSDATDITFTAASQTRGNGDPAGYNANFLRPDAILAVIQVTDEEDCSIPDSSSELFNPSSTTFTQNINVRCGFDDVQRFLHPIERYVSGLRRLKSTDYQSRIVFAGIVGIPLGVNLGNNVTHSGTAELDAILGRPDMQFNVRPDASNQPQPVPACDSLKGDGSAAPARRFVQVAKAFGENGVVTSICEDRYDGALTAVIEKIAEQLTGACLPRKLSRGPEGKVACDVVEVRAEGDNAPCDPSKGRTDQLDSRMVNGTPRLVCRVRQVPASADGLPMGAEQGWYYDDGSAELMAQNCGQRITFTSGGQVPTGAEARFECFQPVARVDATAVGREAINIPCAAANEGDGKCAPLSTLDARLICEGGVCQMQCGNNAECPDSWICDGSVRKICVNPTCPPDNSASSGGSTGGGV